MGSQQTRLGILWIEEFRDEMGPEPSGRSQLRYFHVKVHPDAPEER